MSCTTFECPAHSSKSPPWRIRAEALDRALLRPPEPGPVYIEGVACCRTCQEPILSARLKAKPSASRCVGCQAEAEQGG